MSQTPPDKLAKHTPKPPPNLPETSPLSQTFFLLGGGRGTTTTTLKLFRNHYSGFGFFMDGRPAGPPQAGRDCPALSEYSIDDQIKQNKKTDRRAGIVPPTGPPSMFIFFVGVGWAARLPCTPRNMLSARRPRNVSSSPDVPERQTGRSVGPF